MHLWANAYAVKNRVEITDESSHVEQAQDLPLSIYFHSQEDEENLRERMSILVSRIVCHHIPHFKENYSDVVCRHVKHEFSKEMKQKSELVS